MVSYGFPIHILLHENPASLKSHLRELHPDPRPGEQEQVFRCEECEKVFRKKKDLRGHKYAAHKVDVRTCEVCLGEYKNQRDRPLLLI